MPFVRISGNGLGSSRSSLRRHLLKPLIDLFIHVWGFQSLVSSCGFLVSGILQKNGVLETRNSGIEYCQRRWPLSPAFIGNYG